MARKFKNNASTTLASGIGTGDTVLTVATGEGVKFPALGTNEIFMATLEGAGSMEIVKVTARSTDTFTIVRAQEGTTSAVFASGATVEERWTAESAAALQEAGEEISTATKLPVVVF